MASEPGRRVFHEGEIPSASAGQRFDQVLAGLLPDYSRSKLKQWIDAGHVLLDGRQPKPRDAVNGGEHWKIDVILTPETHAEPQAMPLDIVFEDDHLLVINKPAGLVVHPGAGNPDSTLQNALLHHCSSLSDVPRAGLVHRLDKDTTGLLVVAKTLAAHTHLVAALGRRDIKREYEAVCTGVMTAGGRIDVAIGRHPVDRKRMAVREQGGREAVTHYRVIERFRTHTHVAVQLETGRTHQIRVHLAHQRFPIVGDPVYGRRMLLPKAASEALQVALKGFRRQALHARRLTLAHPASGDTVSWEAPLPADMQQLVSALHDDAVSHSGRDK